MKINNKFYFLFFFILIGINSTFSQKNDTVFYSNKNIRSVEVGKNQEKVLLNFFSEKGENLLLQNSFHYEYFDSLMLMKRVVDVENKKITQEFWVSNNDTIYNNAKFGPDFDDLVIKFYKYVYEHLDYPREAINEKIEGKVIISFIVDKEGRITQIKPLTTIGFGLEDNAIKLINRYKKWGRIYLNYVPISCYFRLPISYRLH